MGKFYASQQANKATDNSLKCGADELKDFGIVNFFVKQASHQHPDHSNYDQAQSEADHEGHSKRQLCLNITVHLFTQK